MEISQLRWTPDTGWSDGLASSIEANLVLVFANTDHFHDAACYHELRALFPKAHIVGCSSAGSVLGTTISDDDIVATAIHLDHGTVRVATADVSEGTDILAVGKDLMDKLYADDLRHVFVLSDGLFVNGSELATGLNSAGVTVTGGLAGDGARFGKTWVMADAPARSRSIAAIAWYGDLKISSGCFAGWQEFGAQRVVTKSVANVVYEIDDHPALELYKKYLGDQAEGLPGSGLRFPLSVQAEAKKNPLIRTLLAVDENAQSLTFAGDVPQGSFCKLMKTTPDNLIDSAGMAAKEAMPSVNGNGICLVVSCVGRRLVLGQLTEEELEVVREKLGDGMAITGFYSYGELAPFSNVLQCELHNQTMTLTTIYE